MKTENRVIKAYNEHMHTVELNELTKKFLPLITEQRQILKEVNAPSLAEFEAMLNLKTNFVNANLSAQALGKEIELKRLQEIEIALNKYDASDDDVNTKGEFKQTFLDALKDKYTTWYEPKELEQKIKLEKIIEDFNALDLTTRNKVNFNYSKQLGYHAFANVHL